MVDGQQAEQLNAAINSTVQQHVFDQVTTWFNSFYETFLWFSLICGCSPSPSNLIHSFGFICSSPSSIYALDKFVELETEGKIQIILHVNFKTEGERLQMTKFLAVGNKNWYMKWQENEIMRKDHNLTNQKTLERLNRNTEIMVCFWLKYEYEEVFDKTALKFFNRDKN